MLRRGQIWWADFGTPRGSSPGYRRPVLIVQADIFNKTNISSVIVATATTNLRLAAMPGNVFVEKGDGGLNEDSVINVTQLYTLDAADLLEFMGILPPNLSEDVDEGLRLVLSLKCHD